MFASTILFVAAIAATVIWGLMTGGRLPKSYRRRACQGQDWRREFPDASNEELRQFLAAFIDAFAFDAPEKLKLNPSDRVFDIYKALYPRRWMADALEIETLFRDMRAKYGFDIGSIWSDTLTLGDIFTRVRRTGNVDRDA